jgi:hypothetical protein
MDKDYLLLKRAALSRPSGQWSDDDFDVLANGGVVGRIFKANASPVGASWMWTLAFGHHEDRTPTHGYAATREAAWQPLPRAGGASKWRLGSNYDSGNSDFCLRYSSHSSVVIMHWRRTSMKTGSEISPVIDHSTNVLSGSPSGATSV